MELRWRPGEHRAASYVLQSPPTFRAARWTDPPDPAADAGDRGIDPPEGGPDQNSAVGSMSMSLLAAPRIVVVRPALLAERIPQQGASRGLHDHRGFLAGQSGDVHEPDQ